MAGPVNDPLREAGATVAMDCVGVAETVGVAEVVSVVVPEVLFEFGLVDALLLAFGFGLGFALELAFAG